MKRFNFFDLFIYIICIICFIMFITNVFGIFNNLAEIIFKEEITTKATTDYIVSNASSTLLYAKRGLFTNIPMSLISSGIFFYCLNFIKKLKIEENKKQEVSNLKEKE